MKKLLLLFVAITAFACSEDEAAISISNEESVTISFDSKHCIDETCSLIYKINNATDKVKLVTVRFEFNRIDEVNGSDHVETEYTIMNNAIQGIHLSTGVNTEVESYIVTSSVDFM